MGVDMKTIAFAFLLAGLSLADNPPKTETKDPVCTMTVDPKTAADKATYKGKTYYFCSKEDKATFMKSPEKYVKTDEKKK
jgi:YHS domain-containing protein